MHSFSCLLLLILVCVGSPTSSQNDDLFDYECRLKEGKTPNVVGKPGKRGPVGPKGDKGDATVVSETRIKNAVTDYLIESRPEGCPRGGVEGLARIYPAPFSNEGIRVYCDTTTDGGGWIVIQRRVDGSTDFYRTMKEYENGFGNKYGEFWLGLKNLYRLTSEENYELRIDVGDFEGNFAWGKYRTFKVGSPQDLYTLTVGDYSGTASRDPLLHHNGREFSAKDSDNDGHETLNCAQYFVGGWWYGACIDACLNGKYLEGGVIDAKGIIWEFWKNSYYSMKFSEMKIRKLS